MRLFANEVLPVLQELAARNCRRCRSARLSGCGHRLIIRVTSVGGLAADPETFDEVQMPGAVCKLSDPVTEAAAECELMACGTKAITLLFVSPLVRSRGAALVAGANFHSRTPCEFWVARPGHSII